MSGDCPRAFMSAPTSLDLHPESAKIAANNNVRHNGLAASMPTLVKALADGSRADCVASLYPLSSKVQDGSDGIRGISEKGMNWS